MKQPQYFVKRYRLKKSENRPNGRISKLDDPKKYAHTAFESIRFPAYLDKGEKSMEYWIVRI